MVGTMANGELPVREIPVSAPRIVAVKESWPSVARSSRFSGDARGLGF